MLTDQPSHVEINNTWLKIISREHGTTTFKYIEILENCVRKYSETAAGSAVSDLFRAPPKHDRTAQKSVASIPTK